MDKQICMCGAKQGDLHEWYCPWPYYGDEKHMKAEWHQDKVALVVRINSQMTLEQAAQE